MWSGNDSKTRIQKRRLRSAQDSQKQLVLNKKQLLPPLTILDWFCNTQPSANRRLIKGYVDEHFEPPNIIRSNSTHIFTDFMTSPALAVINGQLTLSFNFGNKLKGTITSYAGVVDFLMTRCAAHDVIDNTYREIGMFLGRLINDVKFLVKVMRFNIEM